MERKSMIEKLGVVRYKVEDLARMMKDSKNMENIMYENIWLYKTLLILNSEIIYDSYLVHEKKLDPPLL